MNLTLFAVFSASLLGSLHCAAMCGGFASAVCAGQKKSWQANLYFHLGRGLSYLALGVLAAALGQVLQIDGQTQAWIGVLLSGLVIVTSVVAYIGPQLRHFFPPAELVQLGSAPSNPTWLRRIRSLVQAQLADIVQMQSPAAAGVCGLAIVALPCGWLWSYLLIAAAQSTALASVMVMFCFWLGTLPVMAVVGICGRVLIARLGRFGPAVSCVLLIGLASWTIYEKLALVQGPFTAGAEEVAATAPSCH